MCNPSAKHKSTSLRKRLGEFVLDLVLSCMLFCFGGLSLRATRRIARISVFLARPFLGSLIRVIEANLKVAFPALDLAEIRALRTKNLQFMVEFGLDFLQALKHPGRLEAKMRPFFLPAELDMPGQAGVFCSPHLGNWEMLIHFLPSFGRPFVVVAAQFSSPKLNRLLNQARSSKGAEIISSAGAALKVRQAIHEKKFVGLLNDQNISPRHGGIFVRFFGLPAATSRLPAALARRENTLIAAAACCKTESGEFEMIYQPLPKTSDQYQSDWELTADLVAANEKLIRQYPEQYLWLYRRWRYLPNNLTEEQKNRFPFYALHGKYPCQSEMLDAMNQDADLPKVN